MAESTFEDLGPNSGLAEEMYRQYRENPESVPDSWRDFFARREAPTAPVPVVPAPSSAPTTGVPAPPEAVSPVAAPAEPAAPTGPPPGPGRVAEPGLEPERPRATAPAPTPEPEPVEEAEEEDKDRAIPIRGALARIVENMEASLEVPTATSVRTVPAKLLEVNRQILNNHLARIGGGKVSFTHLIAYAVLEALREVPVMNSSFADEGGQPTVRRHEHVNLGLAVDVEKSDGSHSLLVPNIKRADTLDFNAFHAAYEVTIAKVRDGKVTPDDFAGTTGTITNPGTIGTMQSVPRLMPGQGFIVGVGALGFPAEYEGADPRTLARLGVSKVITLTSTYDHRVIQGAESGRFLAVVHDRLLGKEEFYDRIFKSFEVPYEPARWSVDVSPRFAGVESVDKAVGVQQLINMYRVRGHLIANLDPLRRKEPQTHPELDIKHYDLTIWDLDREFPTGGLAGRQTMKLRDILGLLRDAYARTIGVEYMHIQELRLDVPEPART